MSAAVSTRIPPNILAAFGRGSDTMLAHISPREAAILKMLGGSGGQNPTTGLPEFDDSGGGAQTPPPAGVADPVPFQNISPTTIGGALPTTGIFAPSAFPGQPASSISDFSGAPTGFTPLQAGAQVPSYALQAWQNYLSANQSTPTQGIFGSFDVNGQPNYGVFNPATQGTMSGGDAAGTSFPIASSFQPFTVPYDPSVNVGGLYRDYMQQILPGQDVGGAGAAYTFTPQGGVPTSAELASASLTNKQEHLPFNPIGLEALSFPFMVAGAGAGLNALFGATDLGAVGGVSGADALAADLGGLPATQSLAALDAGTAAAEAGAAGAVTDASLLPGAFGQSFTDAFGSQLAGLGADATTGVGAAATDASLLPGAFGQSFTDAFGSQLGNIAGDAAATTGSGVAAGTDVAASTIGAPAAATDAAPNLFLGATESAPIDTAAIGDASQLPGSFGPSFQAAFGDELAAVQPPGFLSDAGDWLSNALDWTGNKILDYVGKNPVGTALSALGLGYSALTGNKPLSSFPGGPQLLANQGAINNLAGNLAGQVNSGTLPPAVTNAITAENQQIGNLGSLASGLLGQVNTGTLPPAITSAISQETADAAKLAGDSATMMSYLQTGTLPPAVAAQQKQTELANEASIRSRYASMGLSGSSAEVQDLQNARLAAFSSAAGIETQLFNTGVTEASNAASLDQTIASQTASVTNNLLAQGTAESNAVAQMVQAISNQVSSITTALISAETSAIGLSSDLSLQILKLSMAEDQSLGNAITALAAATARPTFTLNPVG